MRTSARIIKRSFIYLRVLENLLKEGGKTTSSAEIAQKTGFSGVNVRKDISHFAKVGKPRVGYDIKRLKEKLEGLLFGKEKIRIALFGAGNLGTALLKYPGFSKNNLNISAAFDKDKRKVGAVINGVKVYDTGSARRVTKKKRIDIAIIAVSEKYAQEAADIISGCGIKAVLNFTPAAIETDSGIWVKNIDFTVEFRLLHCLTKKIYR